MACANSGPSPLNGRVHGPAKRTGFFDEAIPDGMIKDMIGPKTGTLAKKTSNLPDVISPLEKRVHGSAESTANKGVVPTTERNASERVFEIEVTSEGSVCQGSSAQESDLDSTSVHQPRPHTIEVSGSKPPQISLLMRGSLPQSSPLAGKVHGSFSAAEAMAAAAKIASKTSAHRMPLGTCDGATRWG